MSAHHTFRVTTGDTIAPNWGWGLWGN